MVLIQNRYADQLTKDKYPNKNTCNFIHLIFDTSTVMGKLDVHMQEMKLDPYLSPCTEANSKSIKDLNTESDREKKQPIPYIK